MITLIDTLFPIIAVVIVYATPKGCNRTINTILACLLIFVFGFEEFTQNMQDGSWYDVALSGVYISMALLFYRVGGHVQSAITSVGAIIHTGYIFAWHYSELPINLFYSEIFTTLTVVQLLVASNGVLRPILFKMMNGGGNGRSHRNSSHAASRNIAHRNH